MKNKKSSSDCKRLLLSSSATWSNTGNKLSRFACDGPNYTSTFLALDLAQLRSTFTLTKVSLHGYGAMLLLALPASCLSVRVFLPSLVALDEGPDMRLGEERQ